MFPSEEGGGEVKTEEKEGMGLEESLNDEGGGELRAEHGEEMTLEELVKKSKEFLREGEYNQSKMEIERLEDQIDKVKRTQQWALSAFTRLNERINTKASQGYEVSEARDIIERAREALVEMDHSQAYDLIEEAREALENSLFLPFPLLEKNVSLKSVIENEGGNVTLEFQVINRMDKPLGEILLSISTPPGFRDLPERRLGMIKPKEDRSVKAVLQPTQKIERNRLADLIMNDKIILASNLDCAYKYPIYKISVKNVSEDPLKNLVLRPFTPESLEARERKKRVEWLAPSDTATVIFELYPKTMKEEILEEEEGEEGEEEEEGLMEEELIDEEQVREEGEEGEELMEEEKDEMEEGEREGEEVKLEVEDVELKEEIRDDEEFLSKGSNYLLFGEDIEHSYSVFSMLKYFLEEENSMVISTTVPYKIDEEFGVDVDIDNLIWLSNVESEYFQVIHPLDMGGKLLEEINRFIEENEEGIIFIDKLERLVTENGFESTLDFLEDVWDITDSSDFTLLTHVDEREFSDEEINALKEKLRLYGES